MIQSEARGPRLSSDVAKSQDAIAGVQLIVKSIHAGGISRQMLELVHMRTSQINGCNACIAAGIKTAASAGVSTERLLALPAWRESALFDDGERAALALAEAMTRLADHPEAVTEDIWAEAAEHFDEPGLAALVSMAALTNFFNRVNTTLRVQPGSW
ncbi:MAG: carboxymuconolactone decarboxylase family protein, partial [Solirubrobacteraceae bacterium]